MRAVYLVRLPPIEEWRDGGVKERSFILSQALSGRYLVA